MSADQFNDFFSSISERVLDGLLEGNVSPLDSFAGMVMPGAVFEFKSVT